MATFSELFLGREWKAKQRLVLCKSNVKLLTPVAMMDNLVEKVDVCPLN